MISKVKEKGQSLIEIVVVLSVASVVITALMISVINSLKNAQFAQMQSRSTKYAQDGAEKVRAVRDRDGRVVFNYTGGSTAKFSDLWNLHMSGSCSPACRFKLDPDNLQLEQLTGSVDKEDMGDGITREIIFEDSQTGSSYQKEKKIIVKV